MRNAIDKKSDRPIYRSPPTTNIYYWVMCRRPTTNVAIANIKDIPPPNQCLRRIPFFTFFCCQLTLDEDEEEEKSKEKNTQPLLSSIQSFCLKVIWPLKWIADFHAHTTLYGTIDVNAIQFIRFIVVVRLSLSFVLVSKWLMCKLCSKLHLSFCRCAISMCCRLVYLMFWHTQWYQRNTHRRRD